MRTFKISYLSNFQICITVILTIFTMLYISHSFAKQVIGVPIWSLSPPAWCWTGRWSWSVGAPALKSSLIMEPRKRGSWSGRFAPPCEHPSYPKLMPTFLFGPFLRWVAFPPLSVARCCSWDFLFSQPDFCRLRTLVCLPFALLLFTPLAAAFWFLRAGPSPMPSMCVSHLTSWCCRTTRLSAARTGAISFWMRLKTSRTSSHSVGSHCSTSTGGDRDGDLWEDWLGLKH